MSDRTMDSIQSGDTAERLRALERENRRLRARLAALESVRLSDEHRPEGILSRVSAQAALLFDVVEFSPMPMQVLDAEGHSVKTNGVFRELFRGEPPASWSFFEDNLIEQRLSKARIDAFRRGEIVRMPPTWINPAEHMPGPADAPRCVGSVVVPIHSGQGRIEHYLVMLEDYTNQALTERALRESEERYRMVVENAGDAICIFDVRGTYLFANNAVCRQLSLPPEQIVGKTMRDLFPPEYAERQIENIRGVIRTRRPFQELALSIVSGQRRYYDIRITPMVHDHDDAALVIARDVTELRRSERALYINQRRLEMVLSAAEVGFWRFDLATGNLEIGPRASAMVHLPLQDHSLPWARWIRAIDRESISRLRGRFSIEGVTSGSMLEVDCHFTCDDGVKKCFLLRLGCVDRDEKGKLTGFSGTLLDITYRKLAEQALHESKIKYRNLAEGTNDLLYSVNAEGKVLYVGPRISRFGFRSDEIIGRSFFDFLHPDDRRRVAEEFQQTAQKGEEFPSEFRLVDRYGHTRWVEDHGRAFFDRRGRVAGITGVLRDITDRKDAQQRLAMAHRKLTTAREEARRHVARELHDSIGQQLIGLQLTLRSVMKHGQEDQAALSSEAYDELASRIKDVIREVRILSHHLYPPTLESLGLAPSLRELARSMGPDGRVSVDCPQPLESLRFRSEAEIALFRIAQEAVSNAIRHGQGRHVEIALRREGSDLELAIVDDGCGFDTAKVTSGLGLNSMHDHAAAAAADLTIQSEPGRTCVSVRIDLDSQ